MLITNLGRLVLNLLMQQWELRIYRVYQEVTKLLNIRSGIYFFVYIASPRKSNCTS